GLVLNHAIWNLEFGIRNLEFERVLESHLFGIATSFAAKPRRPRRNPYKASSCVLRVFASSWLHLCFFVRIPNSEFLIPDFKDLPQLVRRCYFELIVLAVGGTFVRPPPLKDRGMTKPAPLHVIVLHLAHALDAQRLPRQILAGAPAALAAGHAGHLAAVDRGPVTPRVFVQRPFAQRRELLGQLPAHRHREPR